jgi:WD40 repeat protein
LPKAKANAVTPLVPTPSSMVLPIHPVAVCLAATVAIQNCNADTTDSPEQETSGAQNGTVEQMSNIPMMDALETIAPALVDSSSKRQLKKRTSVSFRDDAPPVSSKALQQQSSSITREISAEREQFLHRQRSSTPTQEDSFPSIQTTRSISMKSIFSRDKNVKGVSVHLKSSVVKEAEESSDAPNGFVDGDFASGKVFDLNLPQGCFVMEFHPDEASLLAVGLLNGDGVALYETRTYSLVAMLEQEDAVSALAWLKIGDGAYGSFSLLAVGCLDGSVSLYRMEPNLLELQGADLIHEFQVNAQVRAITLGFYGQPGKEILLTVGDEFGDLTFSRYDPNCEPIKTKTVNSFDSGILGIATTSSGSLIAVCTKTGDVTARRIQRTPDNSLFLGYELYSTTRSGAVRSIVFSDDGTRLVFGGYDKTVVVVDTELWADVRSLELDGTVNNIAFDPLDRYLAVGCRDKSFILYDTSTYFKVKTVHTPSWVTHVSWGNAYGGDDVVAIRSERSCISILDLSPIHMTHHKLSAEESTLSSLSWSHDGRFLARTSGTRLIISDSFQDFSDQYETNLKGHLKCVSFCTAEGMRDHLAVVGLHGHLHILRLHCEHSRILLEPVETKFIEDNLWVVAWSLNGDFIATGGRGNKLHILNTSTLKPKCQPLEIEGRIWAVAFTPQSVTNQLQAKSSVHGMAVGSGDCVATLFEIDSFQPTLKVVRPRTVRCIVYHPTLPLLAVGDGGNIVSIVNFNEEETVQEINVAARVNTLAFSPRGDLLVVGTDNCIFTLHETKSWKIVQEITSVGFAMSACFGGSGKYLALGCAGGDYSIVRLGPFLSINLIPLAPTGGVNKLPRWSLHEVLHRSGNGPSLVQRYMLEGSPDSLRRAAALINSHPDTIFCFDRTTGDSSFDTALKLKKPNLLKLVITNLVDGTLESDVDGRRTILTSGLPERGRDTLKDMIQNSPSEFIVNILSEMTYVKVPFTEAHEVAGSKTMERGSSSYIDPWIKTPLRRLERTKNSKILPDNAERGFFFRTPAVLPLPGLGTLDFLSSLLYKTPPTAFDNVAMGLVLRVMWEDYIRKYFLLDLIVFLFYFLIWVCLVDWTSSTTSTQEDSLNGAEETMAIVMLVLNTIFAAKELRQSRLGRKLSYWISLWNWVDASSIVLVYAYTIPTMVRGVGMGNVPLAVVTTLLLTIKLLSYLRGFDGTGWLISVLVQNFTDVQGFMVVLLAILFGFTASFRFLLGNVPGSCTISLDDGDQFEQTCDLDPFDSIGRSFLSTFELTILGSYDQSVLSGSDYSFLSILTFLVAVLCVLVVTLNALIAVLSDSYARVQENAVANRRKERAELVVEYLSILPTRYRRKIEEQTQYFHALLEADEDGDLLINKDDWEGGLNALKKDLEDLNEEANEMNRHALEELRAELNDDIGSFRREVVSMLENLSEELKQIKEVQSQGGVTFNGKNVARAVKMVKQIGNKGIFRPRDKLT